jgi:hypothetical protein
MTKKIILAALLCSLPLTALLYNAQGKTNSDANATTVFVSHSKKEAMSTKAHHAETSKKATASTTTATRKAATTSTTAATTTTTASAPAQSATPTQTPVTPAASEEAPVATSTAVESAPVSTQTLATATATPVATTTSQTTAAPTPVVQANQILIAGQTIAIENSQGADSAPTSGEAGYWIGNGSTTDGALSYLIGHNNGSFSCLFGLGVGSTFQVVDGNANPRTYTIYNVLEVNDEGYDRSGNDVYNEITATAGETVNLQTCIDDTWNLVVMAH